MMFRSSAVLFTVFNLVLLVQGEFFLRKNGDFNIALILPVHKAGLNGSLCGELDLEKVIELEALIYSVNKIKTIGKDVSIGYDVVDACAKSHAVQTWFSANTSRIPVAIITNFNEQSEFFSVVMDVRFRAQQLDRNLPLISLKKRPNIWSKTYNMAPGYMKTQQAVMKLVKSFQWNTLDALVYKDYEEFYEFKKLSEASDICIRHELFLPDMSLASQWEQRKEGNASVALVFTEPSEAPRLLTELASRDDSARDFVLASEVFGYKDRWDASMRGFLGIRRDPGNIGDFEAHLGTSDLVDRWFNDTVCGNANSKSCDYSGNKKKLIKQLSWRGSSVIDAVYAIVEAGKTGSNTLSKTGLSGIRVTSATGRLVSFDQERNIEEVKYDILNFWRGPMGVKAVEVGEIVVSKETKMSLKKRDIKWRTYSEPKSRCSADCVPGFRRVPLEGSSLAKCCWNCVRCPPGMVSSYANSTRCVECPAGSRATADQTKCQPPYVDYLRWHDPFSLVMIFLLAFTVCFLVYTLNLYVKKATTPVFATSKCASLPLLLSLFLIFILTILLLMKPTKSSCGAYSAMFMFSLGIPLVFLITRSRVLYNYCYSETGELRRKWGHFNPQTVISLILIIILLIFVVVLLNIFPPKVLVLHINGTDVDYIECSCHSRPEFLPYIFFIIALVLVFNLLHISEVNTPESQNEVRYVSLAVYIMYNIFFVYFVTVYAVSGKKKIRIMCAMAYLFGLNYLVTIYLPKIYLILFQPEKNLVNASPLLGDEEETEKPERLAKNDAADSPVLGLGPKQYQRTEV